MSEFLSQPCSELLSGILRDLHNGSDCEGAIRRYMADCDALDKETLSAIIEQLNARGEYVQYSAKVTDFYHSVLTEKLEAGRLQQFAPGHPVRVYLEENRLLQALFAEIGEIDPVADSEGFAERFHRIGKVELHYQRKENQLFPCLERHGWDSPSKNMWAFHDDIRAQLKAVRQALEAGESNKVALLYPPLQDEMRRLIEVEEHRLLPNALQLLDESEWHAMREGDAEIGWMLEETPPPFPPPAQEEENYVHPSRLEPPTEVPFDTDERFHYDEGYMTPEQVNLIFRHLPLDITYVDENDRVVFYNRGEDRVFPRSAGIIGREVRYCHPPKSVDTVLRILEEFKRGSKDVADFRIYVKGRFIQIRYFAVRDETKRYRGVIEMSQDITDIKTLEGEQRLLDWD